MSTQTTNEDLELSVLETDATETPNAAQGVASGLSEPRAGLIEDQPRGAGAGAAFGGSSRLSSLDTLESEAIHIIREVVAEF
jgi:sulfate adenylyltransferase subunit 2